jgi:hypothetical protein
VQALGIYREPQFSPGKVEADAAILDAVLAALAQNGFETASTAADRLLNCAGAAPDLVLAMCQGTDALKWLAAAEQAGAVALNSALAIRNCYRDLLGPGLSRAGVPIPPAALVDTSADARGALKGLDLSVPLYVKRGDLHALSADDVQRVEGIDALRATLASFARRGVKTVCVQQAVVGEVVKFYGVSGGEYFTVLPERGPIPDAIVRGLASAASQAAAALGVEAWGGDAVLAHEGFVIIDFNDWPSYSRVREQAARAIARRAMWLLRRARNLASRAGLP